MVRTMADTNQTLHSVTLAKPGQDEDSDGTWFPSLKYLSTNILMTTVNDALCRHRVVDRFWSNEQWKELKSYLHNLPFKVLDEIYKSIQFEFVTEEDERSFRKSCPHCTKLRDVIQEGWKNSFKDPEKSAIVWWILVDERQNFTLYSCDYVNELVCKDWNLQSLTLKNISEFEMEGLLLEVLECQSQSLKELVLDFVEIYSYKRELYQPIWRILCQMPQLTRLSLSRIALCFLTDSQVRKLYSYIFKISYQIK
jgi:hypothetical protein